MFHGTILREFCTKLMIDHRYNDQLIKC
ncbi:Hypothetical protein F387_00101 [Wohlfahrtiimonas chitiniclastica SH04]|uniref:Uncharacterized protein n=1 Tax=Wohlfahrtiimonas chitiniclastica SH04 TaxID=1261130 RepID=L8Y0W9_9GAMM|nr:Hypothetical protein F387_00101 [Wohlfahrtiimonas chitiniclastica SH04]